MSDVKQLTTSLLLEQSQEMLNLKAAYESLFTNITSDLNGINSSWSDLLSNNFAGKIASAQKSFTGALNMLQNSAGKAALVANTFAEFDLAQATKILGGNGISLGDHVGITSLLNGVFGTDDSELQAFLIQNGTDPKNWTDAAKEAFVSKLKAFPEDLKSAGETLAWIEQEYDKLPREVKAIVNIAVPGALKKAYSFTSDLAQGELTLDSFVDVGKAIGKESPYVASVLEAIEYTYDTGIARTDEMDAAIKSQIMEGDILGVVVEGAEGFVDTILGGTVECSLKVLGASVDAYIKKFDGGIIEEGTKYITGLMTGGEEYSLGDLVGAGGEAISAGIDFATDAITDVSDVVTSGITSGVKGVFSWIGHQFD